MFKTIDNIIDYVHIRTKKHKEDIEIEVLHYIMTYNIRGTRADEIELARRYAKEKVKEYYVRLK